MSYFETLSATLDAVERYLLSVGATVQEPAFPRNQNWRQDICDGGRIAYGETRRYTFQLSYYKNKPTRRGFQVVIYRMDFGRYELTCYCL